MRRKTQGHIAHVGAAAGLAVLAVAARWLLDPWLGPRLPFATVYVAVTLTAWMWGARPACLTLSLSLLGSGWLFVQPRGTFGLGNGGDILSLLVALVTCGLIIGLGEAFQRARRRCQSVWQQGPYEASQPARVEREFSGKDGAAEEITRLKKAKQALQEAARRKDEFLATLAHELRNPLAPIRTAIEFLSLKGPADSELQQGRAIIDRQVQTMARLLDDLLDVSRISRNKLELRRQRMELAPILHLAVETSQPLINSAAHHLTVAVAVEPMYVEADLVRLTQVFTNLLNNAARYTEPGGRIDLTARQVGGEAVVTIKDNGMGIAPEVQPHLFDIFSRGPSAQERGADGLGIGLSLVKGLVELHGGRVAARSAGPGQGSEFTVVLPLARDQPVAGSSSPSMVSPMRPPRRLRILVVDDEVENADSLAMLLEAMGHEVRTAYGGEEALEVAAASRPHLVLLDLGMPRVDGFEAARRLRGQPGGQEIVLAAVTGWATEEDRHRTGQAGFNHHLVKPVGPPVLRDLLSRLTARLS
jgi:signal transduction histidine kinase/CheY-like chemotaxis protein